MPRGPCNISVLRECWVHGVIDDGTLVWGQGLIDWLPVKNVRTLVPQIRTLEGIRHASLSQYALPAFQAEALSCFSIGMDEMLCVSRIPNGMLSSVYHGPKQSTRLLLCHMGVQPTKGTLWLLLTHRWSIDGCTALRLALC